MAKMIVSSLILGSGVVVLRVCGNLGWVLVFVAFCCQDMPVFVGVRYTVAVLQAVVVMLQDMAVGMSVGFGHGVRNYQGRTQQHDQECDQVLAGEGFAQEKKRKESTREGRDGVPGTGFCRADHVLGFDVEKDA